MKFNIKKAFPILGLAMTLGMSSCVNDLNVEPIDPRLNTQVDANKLFNKMYAEFVFEGKGPGDSELDLGDAGLSVLYRLLWNANELTTDEAICGWTDKGIAEFSKNSFTAANESLYGLWWRLNFGVSICNQYLKECADYDKTMTAEAHFMRDLYYYYLLDNFGNPSFSETMPDPDPKQIKSADLYNFIVKDLTENMGNMLPPSVRKKGEKNYSRADQSAAWMLLARLYLNAEKYTGKAEWTKAKEYAEKVIKESGRTLWEGDNATTHRSANGKYSAYQMLFMADNDQTGAYNECIFGFALDGGTAASWGASTFLHSSTWDANMAEDYPQRSSQAWGGNRTRVDLVKKFISLSDLNSLDSWTPETITKAAGDDRALLYGDNADGKHGKKDRKYTNDDIATFADGIATTKFTSDRSDDGPTAVSDLCDNDIMLMRLPEAYYIYAEAEAREAGSEVTLPEGTRLINEVRKRANNTNLLSSYTLDELLDERAREFYFEGLRRTDLIRYGYFGNSNYTWQWKGGVKEGGKFPSYFNIFPIPQTELGTNHNLKQNPGYEG
jgi:hypothetical protein